MGFRGRKLVSFFSDWMQQIGRKPHGESRTGRNYCVEFCSGGQKLDGYCILHIFLHDYAETLYAFYSVE